ncbi:hypothetical protein GCM10028810_24940 [Spirosoma litoris]
MLMASFFVICGLDTRIKKAGRYDRAAFCITLYPTIKFTVYRYDQPANNTQAQQGLIDCKALAIK